MLMFILCFYRPCDFYTDKPEKEEEEEIKEYIDEYVFIIKALSDRICHTCDRTVYVTRVTYTVEYGTLSTEY